AAAASAQTRPRSPPDSASSSRASSTACLPAVPVHNSTASNSASDSAAAPLASSRSRGRWSIGQSRIRKADSLVGGRRRSGRGRSRPRMSGMASTSSATTPATVVAGSHLTLHYRVSLADSGEDVISTFGGRPATLQIGLGQLAEPLERCLVGLAEGARASFDLAPEQAFGPRNPALLQTLSRAAFDAHTGGDTDYQPGDPVEFPAPGGGRY